MGDGHFSCIIEIPKGSRNKYEYDEEIGAMTLDRRLFGAVAFPTDYGFVRSTYTDEVGRRAPGTLLLVDDEPGALAAGIRQALDEPALTRLDPGAAVGLHPAEAARLTFAGWQP